MHYYSSFKFQHIHINTCINCVSASPTHNYNIVINVHITSNNYIYHYSCGLEVNIQPWEIERRSIEEGASKTQWKKRPQRHFGKETSSWVKECEWSLQSVIRMWLKFWDRCVCTCNFKKRHNVGGERKLFHSIGR